ncbi:MAG: hypothetical protein JJU22_16525, partial [Gammaproteobacteria bacterium]|nr:hypothetical protein [Gammaproteobacteria bacterium]
FSFLSVSFQFPFSFLSVSFQFPPQFPPQFGTKRVVAAAAAQQITGDRAMLELSSYHGITIFTLADYLAA